MIRDQPLDALPLQCLVWLPGRPDGQNIAVARRGEAGVTITSLRPIGSETAQALVKRLNREFGISEQQSLAMLYGCMFVWDAPTSAEGARDRIDGLLKRPEALDGDTKRHDRKGNTS